MKGRVSALGRRVVNARRAFVVGRSGLGRDVDRRQGLDADNRRRLRLLVVRHRQRRQLHCRRGSRCRRRRRRQVGHRQVLTTRRYYGLEDGVGQQTIHIHPKRLFGEETTVAVDVARHLLQRLLHPLQSIAGEKVQPRDGNSARERQTDVRNSCRQEKYIITNIINNMHVLSLARARRGSSSNSEKSASSTNRRSNTFSQKAQYLNLTLAVVQTSEP